MGGSGGGGKSAALVPCEHCVHCEHFLPCPARCWGLTLVPDRTVQYQTASGRSTLVSLKRVHACRSDAWVTGGVDMAASDDAAESAGQGEEAEAEVEAGGAGHAGRGSSSQGMGGAEGLRAFLAHAALMSERPKVGGHAHMHACARAPARCCMHHAQRAVTGVTSHSVTPGEWPVVRACVCVCRATSRGASCS